MLTTRPEFNRVNLVAFSLVSSLAWLLLSTMPYEVSEVVSSVGLSPSAAGWVVSIEILVGACVGVWLAERIAPLDKRLLCMAAVAVAILSTIPVLMTSQVFIFIPARVCTAIAIAVLATATNALPALHPQPERVFAYMQLGTSLMFGILMFAIPTMMAHVGPTGLYWVELATLLVFGLPVFLLPQGQVTFDKGTKAMHRWHLPSGAIPVLVALTIMFISQGSTWSYMEQASTASGITDDRFGWLMTIDGLLTPLGAIAATLVATRLGYRIPLIVGCALQAYCAWVIYRTASHALIASGIIIFNATSPFTVPYVQGLLAELDLTGRAAAMSSAAVNFGAAAGPAVAAIVVGAGHFAPAGAVSIIALLACLALLLYVLSFKMPAKHVPLPAAEHGLAAACSGKLNP